MQLNTAKITQNARLLGTKDVDANTHVVLVLGPAFDPTRLPYGSTLRQRLNAAAHTLKPGEPFHTQLPNTRGTRVALLVDGPDLPAFDRLTQARKALSALRPPAPEVLTLACFGLKPAEAERACEAALAAALAADFRLPAYKSQPDKTARLREIRLYGHTARDRYARTVAEARGNNLARYLTALPPNELTPGHYRRRVEKLARAYGWKAEFLGIPKLRKLGAGAFLAVAQGSPEPDAGILHLRYTPRKKTGGQPLALVGKGICFDTGGTNLKNAKYMHGMHEDMQGSAVALGTLLALTELKAEVPVDCWLALAQNHVGPKSYKQNDVVKAVNGKTIEVMHTDAEGRMILADTLTLASRAKPTLIVDYATLTGACIGALSTRLSGALTNRAALIPALIEAGEKSGERVWPFPLPDDFKEALKSDVADLKQCTLDNDADQILAAVFLKQFLVGNPEWVHVDLAAGNHKGGLAHVPSDVTGFGVRWTLEFLADRKALGKGTRF
jgi:leucyl aminopeptidase